MMKKLKWSEIYTDFRKTYKNLSRHALYWHPYGVCEIVVYLDNGYKFVYDYERKEGGLLKERWKA